MAVVQVQYRRPGPSNRVSSPFCIRVAKPPSGSATTARGENRSVLVLSAITFPSE